MKASVWAGVALGAAVLAVSAPAGRAAEQSDVKVVPKEVNKQRQDLIWKAAPEKPRVAPKKARRVLIFDTPAHLMDKDPHKGYCIPYGTYALQGLGVKSGAYEPVWSDDVSMFLPENLKQFDAVVLNNVSGPWITPSPEQAEKLKAYGDAAQVEQKLRESLLTYLEEGGGIVGTHYALASNSHWPAFGAMWGAKFDGHPWNEEVGVKLDEPDHPLAAAFAGKGFRVADEIYQFTKPYSRRDLRVLLSLDVPNTNMGVKWINRKDGDFGLSWVRAIGKGRLFYTAFGHRVEIYQNPVLMQSFLDGIQYAAGDLKAPDSPSAGAQ